MFLTIKLSRCRIALHNQIKFQTVKSITIKSILYPIKYNPEVSPMANAVGNFA